MRSSRIASVMAVVFVASMAFVSPVWAQADDESLAALRFNFSLPGARSLGMGGAFIGLADDATSAFTNPAGLVVLRNTEVAVSARMFDLRPIFTDTGRVGGNTTGFGLDQLGAGDVAFREGENNAAGPEYIAVVIPLRDAVLSIYRHELARMGLDGVFGRGGFRDEAGQPSRFLPYLTSGNLLIDDYGVSVGYSVADNLSVGGGLFLARYDVDTSTRRFLLPCAAGDRCLRGGDEDGEIFDPLVGAGGEPDPLELIGEGRPTADLAWAIEQEGTDTALGFTAGFQWSVSPQVAIGGIYRHGPSFESDISYLQPIGGTLTETATAPVEFNVPHQYGVGIAYKPTARWRVLADWTRIEYSRLVENFTSIYNVVNEDPDASFPSSRFPDLEGQVSAVASVNEDNFTIDDGDIWRLGAEYRLGSAQRPFFVRAGYWRDPDNQIRYEPDSSTHVIRTSENEQTSIRDDETQAAFIWRGGRDFNHVTFGLGAALQNFQVDAAIDYAFSSDQAPLTSSGNFVDVAPGVLDTDPGNDFLVFGISVVYRFR